MAKRIFVRKSRRQIGYLSGPGWNSSFTNRRPLEPGKSNRRRRPILGWTIALSVFAALAIASWTYPAFIFSHPEYPLNYRILSGLGKIEPPQSFGAENPVRAAEPPRGVFLGPKSLFETYSGRSAKDIDGLNAHWKRAFLQNYGEGGKAVFLFGEYEVTAVQALGPEDFFPSGAILRARALDFPHVILEYILPAASLPEFHFEEGEKIRIGKSASLAVILHMVLLQDDRLLVSAIPLRYPMQQPIRGEPFKPAPPKHINLEAPWPLADRRRST